MQTSQASVEHLTDQLFAFTTTVMKHGQLDAMRRFAELDLSFSQMRTLFTLSLGDGPCALGELAEQIGLSVAATGRAVDGLHRLELVARREDERDRRIKRIVLTADGEAMMERVLAARREALRELVALLSDDERERLSTAFEPVLERLTDREDAS